MAMSQSQDQVVPSLDSGVYDIDGCGFEAEAHHEVASCIDMHALCFTELY